MKLSEAPKAMSTTECTVQDGSRLQVDWTNTAIFALVRIEIRPVQNLMIYKIHNMALVSRCLHLVMTARAFSGIKMRLGVSMILIRICFSGLLLMARGRLGLMLDLMGFGIIRDYLIRVHR